MCLNFSKSQKFHFSSNHPRGRMKRWYVCLGNPIYNWLGIQIKDNRILYKSLSYYSKEDIFLQRIVARLNLNYISSLTQASSPQSEFPPLIQETLYPDYTSRLNKLRHHRLNYLSNSNHPNHP